MSTATVRFDAQEGRYQLMLAGEVVGLADVVVGETALRFTHTEVDPRLQGQGLAAVLVEGVLEDLAVRWPGRRVVPVCSYVVRYFAKRPELAERMG
jgi:predicted GNAT family acetyltransferase